MAKKLPIVAIVGRANVGKSSLFNAILERREAIVAREAGTTRDSIMAKATYNDQQFWIVDTAGIKDPDDDFEFTIQEQIIQAADSADIIWVVVEADIPITEEDRRVAKMALKSRKPVFLIINKLDKAKGADLNRFDRLGIKPIVRTSTTTMTGIEELLDKLIAVVPKASEPDDDGRIKVALLGRMDTAGIRRNGKIEVGIEKFSVLRALAAIEESDVCFLLMDVNELNVQLDQKIAGMIKEAGKGLVLVVSKWDDVEGKDAYTRDALAPQIADNYNFVPWAPLIFTSAVSGQNVTKLFDLAFEIVEQRKKRIGTRELNIWLRKMVDAHPPAGLKNRAPKLNYMVQEDDNNTPAFKIFGSHTKFLHWSYKRYLERGLRKAYEFDGTPIELWFIEKHVTHKHGNSPTRAERPS